MESIQAVDGIDLRPVVFIYTLCEPETREVRYVGRTLWIDSRYENHTTRSSNRDVRQWVAGLRRKGQRPLMVVIRRLDGWREGIDAEREEIARHRASCGDRLLNYKSQAVCKPRSTRKPPTPRPDNKKATRQLIRARIEDKENLRREQNFRRHIARGSKVVCERDLQWAEQQTATNRQLIKKLEKVVARQRLAEATA